MGAEARPYAMTALFALAATGVLVLAVEQQAGTTRSARRLGGLLAAYCVLAGLGIALNVYVALLLVGHGLTLLLHPRVSWSFRGLWLVSGVVATLVSAPVVWTAVHQTGQLGGGEFGWVTWARNVLVNQWYLGETPTLSTGGDIFSGGASWKLAAVGLALVGWGLVGLGLRRRPASPAVLWAGPWILVPTLVIGLYSVLVHNMYSARYFTFATAGLALLIAHGLTQVRRRNLLGLALVGMLVLSAPVYVSQRQPYAKSGADWEQAAAFVGQHSAAGEGVYFAPRYPIESTVVRQTTRGVATAYPSGFTGLVDVTLVQSAVQTDDLTGRSALLAATAPRWERLPALWVVRRHDYAYAAQDDKVLLEAGFRPSLRWDGPLDQVVEFRQARQ
jgi:mannosyltransferase